MKALKTIPAFFLILLVGCAGSPVHEAKSPELKAQALYAEYVLAEEATARIMQSSQVPDSVKTELQRIHKQVNPVAEELDAQRLYVAKLKITNPDSVPDALLALNELITRATPLIQNFTTRSKQQ